MSKLFFLIFPLSEVDQTSRNCATCWNRSFSLLWSSGHASGLRWYPCLRPYVCSYL
jgi:hypothetical protein